MKGQLSLSTMAIASLAAALGIYAACHLLVLAPADASVTLSWTASAGSNRIYCGDGRRGQYSNIHHGWVCSTE